MLECSIFFAWSVIEIAFGVTKFPGNQFCASSTISWTMKKLFDVSALFSWNSYCGGLHALGRHALLDACVSRMGPG